MTKETEIIEAGNLFEERIDFDKICKLMLTGSVSTSKMLAPAGVHH